jgi:hypothetical protein
MPAAIAAYGTNQPVGSPLFVATANSDSSSEKPHIFAETGNDSRVPVEDGPFLMYGLRDSGGATADEVFQEEFPDGYRGTVQPAGAFEAGGNLVVFFVGTQFVPAVTQCFSQYNSIIYALEGGTGSAAFDLPEHDGKAVTWENEKITGIQTSGGEVYVSRGLGAATSQPPPMETGTAPSPVKNITVGPPAPGKEASWTTAIKLGSSVCRQ